MDAACAGDICTAVALRDVTAVENHSSILRKGQVDDAITEYLVNKRTGRTFFCSHGGYCYPTHVEAGGDLLEALKLAIAGYQAHPSPADYGGDENITYGVEPIRAETAPALLRYDDLDNKLLEMGLCSACADNVAQYYLKRPHSQCAELTKTALEGNPEALKTLQGDPAYCTWNYTTEK